MANGSVKALTIPDPSSAFDIIAYVPQATKFARINTIDQYRTSYLLDLNASILWANALVGTWLDYRNLACAIHRF